MPHLDSFESECVTEKTELTGKHTKEKKIKKEFKVSADSNLKLNNSYGNVDITTWDENRVVIEVIIKTNGNDEDKVEKRLEEINVAFDTKFRWSKCKNKILQRRQILVERSFWRFR